MGHFSIHEAVGLEGSPSACHPEARRASTRKWTAQQSRTRQPQDEQVRDKQAQVEAEADEDDASEKELKPNSKS